MGPSIQDQKNNNNKGGNISDPAGDDQTDLVHLVDQRHQAVCLVAEHQHGVSQNDGDQNELRAVPADDGGEDVIREDLEEEVQDAGKSGVAHGTVVVMQGKGPDGQKQGRHRQQGGGSNEPQQHFPPRFSADGNAAHPADADQDGEEDHRPGGGIEDAVKHPLDGVQRGVDQHEPNAFGEESSPDGAQGKPQDYSSQGDQGRVLLVAGQTELEHVGALLVGVPGGQADLLQQAVAPGAQIVLRVHQGIVPVPRQLQHDGGPAPVETGKKGDGDLLAEPVLPAEQSLLRGQTDAQDVGLFHLDGGQKHADLLRDLVDGLGG